MLVADFRELTHDLADGPVGDAFAVGQARPMGQPTVRSDLPHELVGQARLAYPWLANDRRHPAAALGDDRVELALQYAKLRAAADQRCLGPQRLPRDTADADQPVGRQGV